MPAPTLPLAAIRQPAFDAGPDGRNPGANDRMEALAGRPLAAVTDDDLVRLLDAGIDPDKIA